MARPVHRSKFELRPGPDAQPPHGAWWPESRSLSAQLTHLVDHWPIAEGHISRILYSPPDWDDRPRSVHVTGRTIKTGSFPRDDTHQITLVLANGQRRTITVIPPDTAYPEARALLDSIAETESGHHGWESEGGHA
jgi:hypothetical protein